MKVYVSVIKAGLGFAEYCISTYSGKHSVIVKSDYSLLQYTLARHNHIIDFSVVNKALKKGEIV